jgi:hypothetical protein
MCDDVQLCNRCVREFLFLARTWFEFGLPSKTGCDKHVPQEEGMNKGEHMKKRTRRKMYHMHLHSSLGHRSKESSSGSDSR